MAKTVDFPIGKRSILNIASFDVDAQKGFTPLCPDELPVDGGHEIADELNAQAEFAYWRIMSKDVHAPNSKWHVTPEKPQMTKIEGEPDMDVHWNAHTVSGTPGCELIPGLPHVREYDFWVTKGTHGDMHPYGACYQDFGKRISTGVIEWLVAKGVNTVIVGGLALDYCVKQTVLELLDAGFTVILNLAATRGIAPDSSEAAMAEMFNHDSWRFCAIENASELTFETSHV